MRTDPPSRPHCVEPGQSSPRHRPPSRARCAQQGAPSPPGRGARWAPVCGQPVPLPARPGASCGSAAAAGHLRSPSHHRRTPQRRPRLRYRALRKSCQRLSTKWNWRRLPGSPRSRRRLLRPPLRPAASSPMSRRFAHGLHTMIFPPASTKPSRKSAKAAKPGSLIFSASPCAPSHAPSADRKTVVSWPDAALAEATTNATVARSGLSWELARDTRMLTLIHS